jgi:protein subunit release factor B
LNGRRRPPMCYTKKDRQDLEKKEARRITESRLMEEEARHRHEEHDRRRAKEEKPLTEKVKEVVGLR